MGSLFLFLQRTFYMQSYFWLKLQTKMFLVESENSEFLVNSMKVGKDYTGNDVEYDFTDCEVVMDDDYYDEEDEENEESKENPETGKKAKNAKKAKKQKSKKKKKKKKKEKKKKKKKKKS